MNPAPTSIKRKLLLGLFFIGVVLAVALAAGGYLYTRITAYVEPASFGSPSVVDAEEAGRKLKQFEDSFKGNRRGFIRLNESELNSLIHQRYFRERQDNAADASPGPVPRLLNARARLNKEDITWYSWVRCDYMGRAFNLIWQRTVQLQRVGDHYDFEVRSMRVGRQTIPRSYWDTVQKYMGDSDNRLADPYQWLTHLPMIEFKPSDESQTLELRLSNYAATPAAANQLR
jgi:hypothetical protein